MIVPHVPCFKWAGPDFEMLHFKRSLASLFVQSNDAFSACLTNAFCSTLLDARTLLEEDKEVNEKAGHPTLCQKLCKRGYEGSSLPSPLHQALYTVLTQSPLSQLVNEDAAAYLCCEHEKWTARFNEVAKAVRVQEEV